MNRDSFVFHREWYDAIKELDSNVRFEIYDAIVAEAFELDTKQLSPLAQMAMKFIRQRLNNDKVKYESICRRNSANGAKGGRPKKTQINPNNPENPVGILETQENPDKPKKADNDIQDTKVSMSISNNNQEKEDTYVSEKKNPLTELEKQFDTFRLKYKSYGGKVRGFEVELADFKKKHKDWKEVVPMLSYAIEKEEEDRSAALMRGEFFAKIKNLKTYLNQRSWECYTDGFENYDPNEYHPQADGILQWWDEKEKCLHFNGYIDMLDDGYTDDNRPDGAKAKWQMYSWIWSSENKEWIKQ